MKVFHKNALRVFYMLLLAAILLIPAFASDAEYPLYVYPDGTTGGEIVEAESGAVLMSTDSDTVSAMTMSEEGIAFIVSYEGFSAYPLRDYSQYSIGYGVNYELAKELFGEDCAPITEEQAMELLRYGLVATEKYMNSFYQKNNIVLNQNQYDALMSFTYNVGIGWTTYKNSDGTWCKLKTLLLSDPSTWTADAVQEAFGTWVKAGGVTLPGLVKRRAAEAVMFVTPCEGATAPDTNLGSGTDTDTNTDTDTDADAGTDTGTDAGTDTGTDTGSEPETEPETEPYVKPDFTDVSTSDWFYAEVMEAYNLDLVSGTGDGSFQPNAALTRSQMVKLLANFHGVGEMDDNVETQFPDVLPGAWYAAEVAWAAENGYVLGCDDGGFHPDDPISREQMCTILARYLKDQGYDTNAVAAAFPDDASISSYAKTGVYYCTALGLINGTSEGTFAPSAGATRAQAAAVMLRAYKLG